MNNYSSTRFWFPSINVRNMIWTLQSKCAVLSVLNQTSSRCYPKSLREKSVFFCAFWKKIRLFLTSKVTCQDKDFVTNKSLLPKSLPKLVALPTANQLLFAVLTYYIPTIGKCHWHCLNQGWPKATKATRARRQACSAERSSAVQHRVAWRGAQALSKGCFKVRASADIHGPVFWWAFYQIES